MSSASSDGRALGSERPEERENLLRETQTSAPWYSGLTEKRPVGRPSDYKSQRRKRNSPWWNTCVLLGVSASPHLILPIPDSVLIPT